MQAVILVGIQAAGKSPFYRERFFGSHVRISLDLLRASPGALAAGLVPQARPAPRRRQHQSGAELPSPRKNCYASRPAH
jgi:predicted kinase